MNRYLHLIILLFLFRTATGQVVTMPYLLNAVSVADSRCDNFICQKGFIKTGTTQEKQTLVSNYAFKGKNKKQRSTLSSRTITRFSNQSVVGIRYETESAEEYNLFHEQLNKA